MPRTLRADFEAFLADDNTEVQLLGSSGLASLCDPNSKAALMKYLKTVDLKYFEEPPVNTDYRTRTMEVAGGRFGGRGTRQGGR